ncbi:MAG: hypothetical protein JOZ18_03380 [Chloroflexi bacterium]|nr:hypothetical protein [Chloroflexota bacterium]
MMKPITGQYECLHSSGVGLDYFTSRIDRIVLQPNGRFVLTIQDRSRISNAAQSLINGQQAALAAPETRREGNYTYQDNSIELRFDDGGFERGQVSWNGEGLQLGPNFFNKVSDSTLLPPTHRLKKDMDDIAKGLKIASTLGGIAVKAVKTIQGTIQSTQGTTPGQQPMQGSVPPSAQPAQPMQNAAPQTAPSAPPRAASPTPPAQNPAPQSPQQGPVETLYCDQCGARVRPGKRFCNNCGAQLP